MDNSYKQALLSGLVKPLPRSFPVKEEFGLFKYPCYSMLLMRTLPLRLPTGEAVLAEAISIAKEVGMSDEEINDAIK